MEFLSEFLCFYQAIVDLQIREFNLPSAHQGYCLARLAAEEVQHSLYRLAVAAAEQR
jgi:hypothetical protein